MVTLYERLCFLCEQKGVSGGKMCSELGLSRSVMTDLKSGRKKGFSAEIAQKIATYFDVSIAFLLGEEEQEDKKEKPTDNDGLSEADKKFFELLKVATEEEKQMYYDIIQTIIDRRK